MASRKAAASPLSAQGVSTPALWSRGASNAGDLETLAAWDTGGAGNKNTPTDVDGLTAGSGVTAVSAGGEHTCAVVKGGVKCWGFGRFGRLGHGGAGNKNTPTDVDGLTAGSGVTAVSAGGTHTCAVVSGGVECWGNGSNGRLGDGMEGTLLTPIDVNDLTAGSGVTPVSAGESHTCAVVKWGVNVKCWGDGSNGRLGHGGTGNKNTPTDVDGLTAGSGVTAVSAGSAHTCALLANGGVKCWEMEAMAASGMSRIPSVPVVVARWITFCLWTYASKRGARGKPTKMLFMRALPLILFAATLAASCQKTEGQGAGAPEQKQLCTEEFTVSHALGSASMGPDAVLVDIEEAPRTGALFFDLRETLQE